MTFLIYIFQENIYLDYKSIFVFFFTLITTYRNIKSKINDRNRYNKYIYITYIFYMKKNHKFQISKNSWKNQRCYIKSTIRISILSYWIHIPTRNYIEVED